MTDPDIPNSSETNPSEAERLKALDAHLKVIEARQLKRKRIGRLKKAPMLECRYWVSYWGVYLVGLGWAIFLIRPRALRLGV